MSWRVVCVSNKAKLDYKMDYLVVRTETDTKRIHLSEIGVLVLESTSISLTSFLLCELSKRKIDIVFCDEKHMPFGSFLPYYGSHDTSLKFREQIKWDNSIKSAIWAEIVRAKISGQVFVLCINDKDDEAALLSSYTSEILPLDQSNREGHAAKVYFNALFGMSFSRSQDNNINSALNYGYSIILSVVAREIVSSGYITQLGLFHNNMFNQYNLACDLMEPFRPYVDLKILSMALDKFDHDEKIEIVNILNTQVMIDGKIHYLTNAIKLYCKSVFDAINDQDISLLRFPCYEL